MRKGILAILASLAILSPVLLVPTRADAAALGGALGIRLAVDAINSIEEAAWGWGYGNHYCSDGTRGEASNYAYCRGGGYGGGGGGYGGGGHGGGGGYGGGGRYGGGGGYGGGRYRYGFRKRGIRGIRGGGRHGIGGRGGIGRRGGGRGGMGGRGGGRGGGGRGGGRRSDIQLKHDITLLGYLDNGLGYYRFTYNGSDKVYVGVIAQEVRSFRPDAVMRGGDGYLWVNYDMLGLHQMTWDRWVASGEKIPTPTTRD